MLPRFQQCPTMTTTSGRNVHERNRAGCTRFSEGKNLINKWQAAGSVVTGANHIRQDLECQDALGIHTDESGFLIIAAADGHGSKSCPHSSDGARIAVRTATKLLSSILMQNLKEAQFTLSANKDDRIPKQLEIMWKEAVKEHHEKKGRDASDSLFTLYGTTLSAVAATNDFVFFIKVGDGDIVMIGEGGAAEILPVEEKIGEDTESLCLDEAWKYVHTHIMQLTEDKALMFLVSTDGYSNSFTDRAGFMKAGEDIYKLWLTDGLESIKESLPHWLRQSSDKGSGDDISLGVVVSKSPSD